MNPRSAASLPLLPHDLPADWGDDGSSPRGPVRISRAGAARHNRATVLRLVSLRGPLVPSELVRLTGLQRSTLHYVLRDLEARGLVEPGKPIATNRVGPRERPISVSRNTAWSAGLGLSAIGHRLLLLDAFGHIVGREEFPAEASVEAFLDRLPEILRSARRRHRLRDEACSGLGVCLPGIIEHPTGIVLNSRSLELRDYPLRERLRRRLRVNVTVERNAVCGAYAEKCVGGQAHAENFLYLIARPDRGGTGNRQLYSFGLAIITGSRVYRGSNSASGELGSVLDPSGRPSEVDPAWICSDDHSELDELLRNLGAGIGRLVNLLDPEAFVIAGDGPLWSEGNLAAINKAALETVTPIAHRTFSLSRSVFGLDGPPYGAALLRLHQGLADRLIPAAPSHAAPKRRRQNERRA